MVDLLAMGYGATYYRAMPTLLNRLVRAAGLAMALVLMGTSWCLVGTGSRSLVHLVSICGIWLIGFLEAFLAGYFVVLTAVGTCHGSFGVDRLAVTIAIQHPPAGCSYVVQSFSGWSWRRPSPRSGSRGFTVCRRCPVNSPDRRIPVMRS